jgi:hypothetical protein
LDNKATLLTLERDHFSTEARRTPEEVRR